MLQAPLQTYFETCKVFLIVRARQTLMLQMPTVAKMLRDPHLMGLGLGQLLSERLMEIQYQ